MWWHHRNRLSVMAGEPGPAPGVRGCLAPGDTTLWGPGRLLVLLLVVLVFKEKVKLF